MIRNRNSAETRVIDPTTVNYLLVGFVRLSVIYGIDINNKLGTFSVFLVL